MKYRTVFQALLVLALLASLPGLGGGLAAADDRSRVMLQGNAWKLEIYQEYQFGFWTTLDKLVHMYESSDGTVRSVHFTCATGSCENAQNLLGCTYQTIVVPVDEGVSRIVHHVCQGARDAGNCLGMSGTALNQATLNRPADSLTVMMKTLGILDAGMCNAKPLEP